MGRTKSLAWAMIVATAAHFGCASVQQNPIDGMVRSADSAADHWRIVEYYRGEADEARRKSAEHGRLAEVYDGRHKWGDAFADLAGDHCRELSALEGDRAAHYEKLAAEHERLAQE